MKHDRSMLAILGSNALTVGVASWQAWPLVLTLWPYWCQSLVIGWYARRRILTLRAFTTTGFTIDGRRSKPMRRRSAGPRTSSCCTTASSTCSTPYSC